MSSKPVPSSVLITHWLVDLLVSIGIIIPAAGRGTRFGSDLPKQYHELAGVPILARTLGSALHVPNVVSVVVAISPDDTWFDPMLEEAGISDERLHRVDGDVERQYSIRNALGHPSLASAEVILVHDAVRPLASADLFTRIANAAFDHGAVIPVMLVTDTIKRVSADGIVHETVPRGDLRRVQTPQGFRADVLRTAYDVATETDILGTDDASLVEAAGTPVHTIDGEPWNIKITTSVDIAIAASFIVS